MVLRKFALAVVLIGMVGCGKPHYKALGSRGVAVMEAADSMELMTLYPFPSEGGSAASQPEIIHGYRILGRAMVTDAAARRRLVDALFGAIDGSNGPTPSCFNPRHALRATRGGKTVEVIICFECRSLMVYGEAAGGRATIRPDEGKVFVEIARQMGLPDPPEKEPGAD